MFSDRKRRGAAAAAAPLAEAAGESFLPDFNLRAKIAEESVDVLRISWAAGMVRMDLFAKEFRSEQKLRRPLYSGRRNSVRSETVFSAMRVSAASCDVSGERDCHGPRAGDQSSRLFQEFGKWTFGRL